MTDNRTGLPEGTDKVIGGASTTTPGTAGGGTTPGSGGMGTSGAGSIGGGTENVVTADTTSVSETQIPASSGSADRTTPGSGTPGGAMSTGASGGDSGSVVEKLRSGSEKLTGQAADKARDLVSQGLERSADALANVGRLVNDTASGLDERLGPEFGDYARRAGSTIEETASRIAAKDPDELIDDTRDFVRKSPAVALAGAAIVGFALARLIKTGIESARGSNGGGERRNDTGGDRGGPTS